MPENELINKKIEKIFTQRHKGTEKLLNNYSVSLRLCERSFGGNVMANNVTKGKLTFPAGDYEGEILDGKPHGKGKLIFSDGDVYEGNFVYGKLTKGGKYTTLEGDEYEDEDGDYFVEGCELGDNTQFYINDDGTFYRSKRY